MEDKYYTPDKSEFYIGFEYEESAEAVNPKTWHNYTIEEAYEIGNIGAFGKIRVKKLDQKDIKSLGWKKMNPIDDRFLIKKEKKSFVLVANYKNQYIGIHTYHKGSPEANQMLFAGRIRNKSELMTILNMVGI